MARESSNGPARAFTAPSKPELHVQPWLDRMSEVEMAVLKPLGTAGTAMADAWADMFEEWTAFVARRVRQDVRTMHAVLHCRNPQDLQAIQADFVQSAIDAYQAEAGRMTELMEHATRAVSGPGAKDAA